MDQICKNVEVSARMKRQSVYNDGFNDFTNVFISKSVEQKWNLIYLSLQFPPSVWFYDKENIQFPKES